MERRILSIDEAFSGCRWFLGESRLSTYLRSSESVQRLTQAPLKYRTVGMGSGVMAMQHIDSLGAFWPGLQVLAGDVESAIKSHLACEYLLS